MKVIMLSIACREEGTVWIVKKQHDVPCLLLSFCSSFNSSPSDLWSDKEPKLFSFFVFFSYFFQRTHFGFCVSLPRRRSGVCVSTRVSGNSGSCMFSFFNFIYLFVDFHSYSGITFRNLSVIDLNRLGLCNEKNHDNFLGFHV